jgi:hypothetical protein
MLINKKNFIRQYVEQILEGNAAVFAGAGMSVSAGYVDWKELLRDIACELNLDIDKENDLVAIAQYHANEMGGRGSINQRIINLFTANTGTTETHRVLARLPIKTYWTTNYDNLIENQLKAVNKKVDVKRTPENLAVNIAYADATVYKMHGDAQLSDKVVITKDDYETYNEERQLFTTALQGDLISKTFLFIGFSFEDPNLNYILSRIRILLGKNKRTHYAFFKKADAKDDYVANKQRLLFHDLERYSINPVVVDSYDEIPIILSEVEKRINLRNIFISGSAEEYGNWNVDGAVELINNLIERLISIDRKIITGFGLGIGSFVINKAIQTITREKNAHFDKYLEINPFAFQLKGNEKTKFNTDYRDRILNHAGIAIFMFGNKHGADGNIVVADGVLEEFEIAKQKRLYIIPLGSTGFAAEKIAIEIKSNIESYPYLKDYITVLTTSNNSIELVDTVCSIIRKIGGCQ